MATTLPTDSSSAVAGFMSVDEITRQAQEYDYDPSVPFLRWIRSATSIQHQVLPPRRPFLNSADIEPAGKHLRA
jgi:hypothetical protein